MLQMKLMQLQVIQWIIIFHIYKTSMQGASRPRGQSEDLLLDWTDDKEQEKKAWQNLKEFEDTESKVSQWIQFNDLESREMESQFER